MGHLQDLLRGHGYTFLPDARARGYRVYGSATSRAIADFRRAKRLAVRDLADADLIRALVRLPAARAVMSPAYVPLVLDVAFGPILRFVWLTSLFETGGVFDRLNLNTDQCGISIGILQWSQKSGQLHGFLRACRDREPEEWASIMENDAILDYISGRDGGVDARGRAIDPAFDLTRDPWKARLRALGASRPLQRVQLALASEAYAAALARQSTWARAVISERGCAFLLDLANQFGGGRVTREYRRAAHPGAPESEILKSLEDAFTAMARPKFQAQVRARREFFRTTGLLSDEMFQAPAAL